jgi:DNA-binding transcriptional regulator YdaS (Cro superfamily)
MGPANRGELKRAARQLGVTSTTLRQHGWRTASPARVKAAAVDARHLAGEMTMEQVRARIGRERDASDAAACYRAGQLLRRALEG